MNQTGQINQDLLLLQLRATTFGISYNDLLSANRAAIDWRSWSKAIAQFALRYEQLAEQAMVGGHPQSSAQWWQSATNYYHFAQMFMQGSQKIEYQTKSRQAYCQFTKLAPAAPQRIAIAYQAITLPGYIQVSHAGAPVVILLGGLEFAKEVELHQLGQPFLARGVSVVCFDTPGQGELSQIHATTADFELTMKAVLDFLYAQAYATPASPVGIFGICAGGFGGMRAAAIDKRIAACISVSGFADGGPFLNLSARNKEMIARMFGVDDDQAMAESAHYFPALPDLPQAVACPLLLVHGSADHLVPIEQIERLQAWAQGEIDTWILEGAEHICYSRFGDVLPVLGDWMAAQLGESPPVDKALFKS